MDGSNSIHAALIRNELMIMTNIWVCSDHHLGHSNIVHKFKRDDGSPLRDFSSIEEHDELIIKWHNELVKPQDHVYFLGDVVIARKNLHKISRFNGKKRLVRGNHDIFKTKEYIEAGFEEIYGVRVWPKHNYIFSHIPLHESCLESRDWINVHGHTHYNLVKDKKGHSDPKYRCVCLEHTNYRPVLLIK
jgi:calcineurin-like phosphoesterase family protein